MFDFPQGEVRSPQEYSRRKSENGTHLTHFDFPLVFSWLGDANLVSPW